MELIAIAAVALLTAGIAAVWRAWQEARARQEAEERAQREAERAQREAEAREAEARARQEAEERAQREAERAQREAEAREAEARARQEAEERAQRARARAKAEIEAREAEAQARKEAEARARAAERRAARLGAEIAESRCNAPRRVDEKTLVDALSKAVPNLDAPRARRIQNQLETLARLRSQAEQIRKGIEATKEEDIRVQLQTKLNKCESDAEALVERLRNIVDQDPDFHALRLSLAWGVKVSTNKANKKKAEEK